MFFMLCSCGLSVALLNEFVRATARSAKRLLTIVILSVHLSSPGTNSSPGEIWTPGFCCIVIHRVSSLLWPNVMPLDEEIPLMSASKWDTLLRNRYFAAIARLAWEWLQIHTDLLLIITSTADELSGGTNIIVLERPWNSKIAGFSEFFSISGCDAHWKSEFSLKLLEIDQNNLHTKLNRCCRASHAH